MTCVKLYSIVKWNEVKFLLAAIKWEKAKDSGGKMKFMAVIMEVNLRFYKKKI